MTLLLTLLVYYLGAIGTLLLIWKNVPPERFIENGGKESLYKIGCISATLIWPITLIIGCITLIITKIKN